MSTRIGSIVVDLTANTVSFSSAMTKASELALNSSKNIQRSFNMISAAATAMAATVLASFTAATVQAQNYAFEMERFAEITGTSVEMMSKLAFTAKNAGTPIDTLKSSMERLSRTAGAAMGGQKQFAQAYEAIGISAKDLKGPLADSGDLMVAVAKKLDTMKESTAKTALEQKLLGRGGAELSPMLHELATSFDSNSAAATKYGIVIDSLQADRAKKFNQSIVAMQAVLLGLEVKLLNGVSPALVDVGQKITEAVSSANGMRTVQSIATSLATAIRVAGDAFQFLWQHASTVKIALEGYVALRSADIFLKMGMSAAKAGTSILDIGTALSKIGGKLTGLSTFGPMLATVTSRAWGTSIALLSLARSEGKAATATYALESAQTALNGTLLSNPYTGIAAVLGIIATKTYFATDQMLKSKDVAATWGDLWNSQIETVGHNLEWLAAKFKQLTFQSLDQTEKQILAEGRFTPNHYLKTERDKRLLMESLQHPQAPGRPSDKIAGARGNPLRDAPVLPSGNGIEKLDPVKKKLEDLRVAAEAAKKALEDAGKGADFKRQDEAAAEAKKTIADLNLELARHHKQLTAVQEAQIKSLIASKVNDESQAKFREELVQTTRELLTQADAMDIHTAALGRGADEVLDAMVRENALKADSGKDPEWLKRNEGLRKTRDDAYRRQLQAGNASQDDSKLDDLRLQIALQTSLNGALGKGKDALDAITLSNQQAEITADFQKRGDNDQQRLQTALDTAKEMFDLKQQEALLNRAASMDPARAYTDEIEALSKMKDAANEAGIAISDMQMKAARQDAWDSYLRQVDSVLLKVGDLKDGVNVFFSEMVNNSKSAAQQVHDVLSNAFDGLNRSLTNLMMGQKANFAEFFRGIGQQLATMGLQKAESTVASALFDLKTDPTAQAVNISNGWLERIYGALSSTGASGGNIAAGMTVAGAAGGSDSVGNAVGSVMSSVLGSFIPGGSLLGGLVSPIFGGHRALGGDVKAGMTYDVGEMGRERFTPTMDGKITPNNQLGTGPMHVHVDARGATDPAAVEQAATRAVWAAAPHIISAAGKRQASDKMRTPNSRG